MELLKFFKKGEQNISPENKEILNLLKELEKTEKNQRVVTSEKENSGFWPDYRSGADDHRIRENEDEIRRISEKIMIICEAGNLDPYRFLKPEYIKLVEEKRMGEKKAA